MIYRDEKKPLEGVYNRETDFVSSRHVLMFGENINDIGEYLIKTPGKWSYRSAEDSPARDNWDLSCGYTGATTMAKDGWSEGVEMIDEALQAITPATGREARWGWAQTGGSVSVGKYLTGHPKHFRNRRKKQMGSAPVLHIAVNVVASCMVRANQMANYGAAIVGLIDRLENMGKRVHLDVVMATKLGNTRLSVGWNVKKASEAVDLSQIAFAIAHPAAFRRIGFALMQRSPSELAAPGYGYCCDTIPEDAPDYREGTMLVDGVNHEYNRCNSPKDALRLAIEQLNKASVIAGHSTPDQPLIDEDEWLSELAD